MILLKNERLKTIIVILIFIAVWVWNVIFVCKYGETYLDDDMASEMVLADKSNEDGVYLDKDWFYSSEIRVIGHIMLFKPLLLLFSDNWGLVRIIAQAIILLAAGTSYIYMTGVLGNLRRSIFFAAVLLCPFGYWHLWHDCFDGNYFIFTAFYSVIAGLIFRLIFYKTGARKYAQWILLLLLSFVCGLQSIRIFMNLLLPMLIAMALLLYGKYRTNEGKKITYKSLRPMIITIVICMSSAMGYLINHFVLSRIYTYIDQDARQWQDFSFSKILDTFGYFLQLFGYPYNLTQNMEVVLFSKCGLLSCCGILLMFIVVGSFIFEIRKFKQLSEQQKVIFMTALMTVPVCVMIFATFLPTSNGSYFLPSIGLCIAVIQIATDVYSYAFKKYGRYAMMTLILLMSVFSGMATQKLFLRYPTRSEAELVNVAATLKEQGYTQAYSTFWKGNSITELTDGSVEVWVTEWMDTDRIYKFLQSKSHLTTRPQGRYAYVYETEEYTNLVNNYPSLVDFDNACIVYQNNMYTVIGVEE